MRINTYKVNQLYEDTYALSEPFSGCILYLLVGEEGALLIDTGMGTADLKNTVAAITDKTVKVVNTHGHIDHIANNCLFSDIYICEDDREVLAYHQSPEYIRKLLQSLISAPLRFLLKRKLKNILNPRKDGNYHFIKDGYLFDLGNRKIEVIQTPGHTPGSICLLDRKHKSLYSGDTVCDWGILLNLDFSLSVHRYLESIYKLESYRDAYYVIHPGHRKIEIEADYIRKYKECAQCIIQKSLPLNNTGKKDKGSKEAVYEDIRIQLKGED